MIGRKSVEVKDEKKKSRKRFMAEAEILMKRWNEEQNKAAALAGRENLTSDDYLFWDHVAVKVFVDKSITENLARFIFECFGKRFTDAGLDRRVRRNGDNFLAECAFLREEYLQFLDMSSSKNDHKARKEEELTSRDLAEIRILFFLAGTGRITVEKFDKVYLKVWPGA